MKPKKMFLGGLLGRKKKDDDKPMTMTQKKAEEAKKRAIAAQMRSESEARRGRTASRAAVGGAKNPPARKTGSFTNPAEVKKRNTARFQDKSEALRKEALKKARMAKVKKDRPMPKRPSAISLANAATPKPTRPAKPQKEPTTAPRPPKAEASAKPTAKKPPRPLRGTVTGKGGRNVGEGRDKRANVTREQLKDSGMTLRQYLNFMDKEGKRPPKKAMGGGMMKSKMKAKGYRAGGGPLKKAPEGNTGLNKLPKEVRNKMGFMSKGGMTKSKGYAKGGAMKTKGYKAGGKVRGAGIARKGVRPAKIR
jgi:hypothetical protein